LIAAGLAVGCDSDGSPDPTTAASSRPAWQRLPAPPKVRENAVFLAAGDRLLLLGGCAHDYRDDGGCGRSRGGWSYVPGGGEWTEIPDAPRGLGRAAAWTGEEVVIEGFSAFDPATGEWRELPPSPLRSVNAEMVWAGDRLIAWGGAARNGTGRIEGAAYDPATDSWSGIAKAPVSLNLFDLVWTAEEAIAFGADLDRRNRSATRFAVGAAYDPSTDSWRELPESKLAPNATSASWLDGRLLAYDYYPSFQSYDPAADRWSRAEKLPLDPGECYPDSVASDDLFVAFYCGQIATYDPATGRWRRVDGGLTDRIHRSGQLEIPVWRFAQLAALGDTVYFLAEGVTFGKSGITQYGFPEAPSSFWSLAQ
jgi:hypothetical protein